MDRPSSEDFGYELFLPQITVYETDHEPIYIGLVTEHGVPIKRVIYKQPIGFELRKIDGGLLQAVQH